MAVDAPPLAARRQGCGYSYGWRPMRRYDAARPRSTWTTTNSPRPTSARRAGRGCRSIDASSKAYYHQPIRTQVVGAVPGRRATAWAFLFYAANNKLAQTVDPAMFNLALQVDHGEAFSRIARASHQNWGMTLCEFFHMAAATPQEIANYIEMEGTEAP